MSGVVNRTKQKNKGHMNFDGGQSYMVKSPLLSLYTCAASSFFGEPAYYIPDELGNIPHLGCTIKPDEFTLCKTYGETTISVMRRLIKDALDYDAKATLELACHLRQEANIRTTPTIILAEASMHPKVKGTGLVREFAPLILHRLDEVTTAVAYLNVWNKRKIPNSIKRAIRDRIEFATPYEIAKYRMKNRDVSLVDVVNITHPHARNEETANALAELVSGNLRQADVGETWESIISGGGSWNDALEVMGHMAILRNVRNLMCNGIPVSVFRQKLLSGCITGRQLPFRYWAALKELELRKGDFTSAEYYEAYDVLEECMNRTVEFIPQIPGRTIVFVDNSGSATNTYVSDKSKTTVAQAANLLASIIINKSSGGGHICPFGDRHTMLLLGYPGILEGAKSITNAAESVGLSTEAGLYTGMWQAIEEQNQYDNIVILSDMQCGHGTLHDGLYGEGGAIPSEYVSKRIGHYSYIDLGKLIAKYRQTVNPDAYLFSVQCAGYPDNIIPFNTKRDFIFGGWNESVVKYMAAVRPPIDNQH